MISEAQIRLKRAGHWLQQTSEKYAGVSFVISSIYGLGGQVHLAIVVQGATANQVEALAAEWRGDRRVGRVDGPYDDPRGTVFHFAYPNEESLYPLLASNNLFDFRFTEISGGNQYLSLVGRSEDVQRVLRELDALAKVDVISIRRVSFSEKQSRRAPGPQVFNGLTEPQLNALVYACENDYYTWPRRRSVTALAHSYGVAAPTFLRHLRKAEAGLIKAALRELSQSNPTAYMAASRHRQRPGRASQNAHGHA